MLRSLRGVSGFRSLRRFYAAKGTSLKNEIDRIRNIGISAHIDSGKTTLTERILFYTGRIEDIHEVRGRDGVGAKMDSMDLEREKGITIKSAATYTQWKDHHINIIDTPGHVDFTIEVERSLRVLDGAVLVVCSVGSVQSQTMTVDRQMKRYNVPRLVFINKLDRGGANPDKVIKDVRAKLRLNAAAVQIPIGLEDSLKGVVDLIEGKAYYFEGIKGEQVVEKEIPDSYKQKREQKLKELVESLAEIDPEIEDLFLMEEIPTQQQIKDAIRRQTLALKFCPVFCGSAFKNKGVQKLLDGVIDYLPNPSEVENFALDLTNKEAKVQVRPLMDSPLVALAFKLEKNRFGQLTFMRIYQGMLKRGSNILPMVTDSPVVKGMKVPRLVRMHSAEMEEIDSVGPGEICAMFGVDCTSGTTFTDGSVKYTMTSMFIPEPVMSFSVKPKESSMFDSFQKALLRFQQEDPTFRVMFDTDTNETIISGMGELHLNIYLERMEREYSVITTASPPRVRYYEMLTGSAEFDYLHKKQSGGAGQYGRVMGRIEPLEEGSELKFEFVNNCVGDAIPPEFFASIEKGFRKSVSAGPLTGSPIENMRVILTGGASHPVDSNDRAFQAAAIGAFRQAYEQTMPIIMQPYMNVEIECPTEFQGDVIAALSKRRATIKSSSTYEGLCVVEVEAPLVEMFGYANYLRSQTEGKGGFSMEYLEHRPVQRDQQDRIAQEYQIRKKEDAESDL